MRLERNVFELFKTGSIAASATISLGTIDCDNVRTLSLTAALTYDADSTAGATVNVYFSPDGSNWDTVPYDSWVINLNAGNPVQESKIYDLLEHGFVEVKITNGSAHVLTRFKSWYSISRYGDEYIEADKILEKLSDIERTTGEIVSKFDALQVE